MSKKVYDISEILLELLENKNNINEFIYSHRISEYAMLYFIDKIKWGTAINNQRISEKFIKEHLLDIINEENLWQLLFKSQKLSEDFIQYYLDLNNKFPAIDQILEFQKLSEDFLIKNIKYFKHEYNLRYIFTFQKITDKFLNAALKKYGTFSDGAYHILEKCQHLSHDFMINNIEYLDYFDLIKYQINLPDDIIEYIFNHDEKYLRTKLYDDIVKYQNLSQKIIKKYLRNIEYQKLVIYQKNLPYDYIEHYLNNIMNYDKVDLVAKLISRNQLTISTINKMKQKLTSLHWKLICIHQDLPTSFFKENWDSVKQFSLILEKKEKI